MKTARQASSKTAASRLVCALLVVLATLLASQPRREAAAAAAPVTVGNSYTANLAVDTVIPSPEQVDDEWGPVGTAAPARPRAH